MSFPAKYAGKCGGCGDWFNAAAQIEKIDGSYVHEGCEPMESSVELKKNEVVCTECWLVQPCGC